MYVNSPYFFDGLVRQRAVHLQRLKEAVMPPVERKEERLEARITPAQKRLIERAAALRGTSVTEFVVASAQEAATSTIKDFEVLQLRDEAPAGFIQNVFYSPAPPPA